MQRGHLDSAKRGSSSSYTTTESDSDVCDEFSTAKKVTRQLTVATFEKWQRIYKQEHQILTWLHCKCDRNDSTMVEGCFVKCIKHMKTIFVECEIFLRPG